MKKRLIIDILIGIVLLGVGAAIGARTVGSGFMQLCSSGEKFYNLSPDGDVPYRCNRVIDAPPTTTE